MIYDIFYIVFEYVDFKTYRELLYVCKTFNIILKSLKLYDEVCIEQKMMKIITHVDRRNNLKYGLTHEYTYNFSIPRTNEYNIHLTYFIVDDVRHSRSIEHHDDGYYIVSDRDYEHRYIPYCDEYMEIKYLFNNKHEHVRAFDFQCNIIQEIYIIREHDKALPTYRIIIDYCNNMKTITMHDYKENIGYKYVIDNDNDEYNSISYQRLYSLSDVDDTGGFKTIFSECY